MWSKSYSITTKEITKEQIWKLTTDINNWNKWDPTVEHSKLLGSFSVGTYFELKPKGGPKVKIKLIEVIENIKFSDETRFPLATMTGEHLYEETNDGLKITITMSVTGFLSFLWIKLVAQDIVNHLPEDIQNQINHAKLLKP
jgi:hypothetical protein